MSLSGSKLRKKARALLKKSEEQELSRSFEKKSSRLKDVPQSNRKEAFTLKFGRFEQTQASQAYLVIPGDVMDGGAEIKRLSESLGLEVTSQKFLKKGRKITGSTYLGQGTLEQIQNEISDIEQILLIVDARLSPGQIRNLENFLKIPVLDRRTLILAIFKRNAQSHVAKLQVELAELQILKSRLAGVWEGLSRQRGAAGGKGGRGLGETRLELDRRTLRRRIEAIKAKLKSAEKAFYTQSQGRSQFPRVALVGYTNAGKSSLMRKLTQTEVHVEDKLFATLDTTVRTLQPLTYPKILVSDTVGFVRDLPAELVASFKSTLLEAVSSSLLLHVVDISDDNWKEQIKVTDKTLEEIGAASIPKFYVFNKMDILESFPQIKKAEVRRYLRQEFGEGSHFLMTSTLTGEGLSELRLKIMEHCGVNGGINDFQGST
jgi:GTP-binding protein HflX